MRNLNEVVITGNIVKDPIVRTNENKTFTDIMVASNRKAYQLADGSWKQDADYIPVSVVGKAAERVAKVKKGDSIALRGSLESYRYDKNGETVFGLRVHLAELIYIEPKKEG